MKSSRYVHLASAAAVASIAFICYGANPGTSIRSLGILCISAVTVANILCAARAS